MEAWELQGLQGFKSDGMTCGHIDVEMVKAKAMDARAQFWVAEGALKQPLAPLVLGWLQRHLLLA